MEQKKWLVINYNLPTEPSRIRVATWRNLKKLGAVNTQQSMWILPYSDDNCSALASVSQDIRKNSGEAFLMQSVFLDEKDEERAISYFNRARDEEYKELIEKCGDFFAEIEKETARKNFSFAEVEENEEELDKLLLWYRKIESRDLFKASLGKAAKESLDKCKKLLEDFSNTVYEFILGHSL
ncbi:MAG: chromate resistance protein ChrB [Clostridiales bacterium]|jgi:DNA-binding transcriptional regulator PaaX|nr:chromate resistance protein ChrB [Eubacteriales bacterium]MDH7567716.1 chromate resistance protein ChrB [Clostridiales bacterium]